MVGEKRKVMWQEMEHRERKESGKVWRRETWMETQVER